jgi:oligopeptide/dipeptide ABC transporter ATP-binding protein
MYLGKIVESGSCEEIFKNPKHPYTKALLSSVPIPDPQKERKRKQIILNNEIPSPINMPRGCVFHPRCSMVTEPCKNIIPKKVTIKHNHSVNCNLFHE